MKVIHVPRRFDARSWGGTEQVVCQLTRVQRAMGHEACVFCPDSATASHEETVHGAPTRHFPYFYPFWGLSDEDKQRLDKKGGNIFSFSLLRALMREPGVDILHLHTLKRTGGIGRWVARRRRIPYIVHLHGGLYDVPDDEKQDVVQPLRGAFEWGRVLGWWVGSRRVVDDAAAIVTVGKREAELAKEHHPGKRVLALPNGVDVDRFREGDGADFRRKHELPQAAPVLLQVARIDHQKNQRLVVEAMPYLLEVFPDTHVVFAGPVTNVRYADAVKALADAHPWRNRVHFVGPIDPSSTELVNAYHAADVVILPSLHEPFGIAVLEAWAAGRAVAAARVGGIPDFTEDGLDAQLFDSTSPEDFAHAVAAAVRRRRELAEAGRRKVERHYSWQKVAAQLGDLYEKVIHENPLRQ